MNPAELGAQGERIAADHLRSLGWKIVDRNVAVGNGEIDIIAVDGDELVMVEVRTRTIGKLQSPADSVGPLKLGRLVRAARSYAEKNSYEGFMRIDLVSVTVDEKGNKSIEVLNDISYGRYRTD